MKLTVRELVDTIGFAATVATLALAIVSAVILGCWKVAQWILG